MNGRTVFHDDDRMQHRQASCTRQDTLSMENETLHSSGFVVSRYQQQHISAHVPDPGRRA